MEYCDKGDLFQKITQHKKADTHFTESEIWNMLVQILLGLRELHKRNIYHRDLKSANIFLTKQDFVKVGDMNVSKLAKNGMLYTQTGTPYYASPEVWKDEPYDHKSDIWSLGCIIYEMATLKPPFRAESMEGLYKKVIKGSFEKLPNRYSKELTNVLKLMLRTNPDQRVDCDGLLSMPGFMDHLDHKLRLICDENNDDRMFLSTIRIPNNIFRITENMPKPNYMPLRIRNASQTMVLDRSTPLQTNHSEVKNIYMSMNLPENGNEGRNFINILKKHKKGILPINKKNENLQNYNKEGKLPQIKRQIDY